VALPEAWTEATLLAALEAEVEAVMTDLGLDTLDVLVTAAGTDVPAVLGVSSVAAVTYGGVADVVKVLTIGRWAAWQRAVDVASVRFDLKAGSADLKQSQQWAQLSARLESARAAAMRYSEVQDALGSGSTAYVSGIGVAGNPYAWPTSSGW
jgi:hypothetical protein